MSDTPRDCTVCKHTYYNPCDGKNPDCGNKRFVDKGGIEKKKTKKKVTVKKTVAKKKATKQSLKRKKK